jgi:hypothetical protein
VRFGLNAGCIISVLSLDRNYPSRRWVFLLGRYLTHGFEQITYLARLGQRSVASIWATFEARLLAPKSAWGNTAIKAGESRWIPPLGKKRRPIATIAETRIGQSSRTDNELRALSVTVQCYGPDTRSGHEIPELALTNQTALPIFAVAFSAHFAGSHTTRRRVFRPR